MNINVNKHVNIEQIVLLFGERQNKFNLTIENLKNNMHILRDLFSAPSKY